MQEIFHKVTLSASSMKKFPGRANSPVWVLSTCLMRRTWVRCSRWRIWASKRPKLSDHYDFRLRLVVEADAEDRLELRKEELISLIANEQSGGTK